MVRILDKLTNWLRSGDTNSAVNKTCHDPSKDLVDCMSDTDCFKNGGSIKYCATHDDKVALDCKKQLHQLFLCRKFSVDHTKHWVKDNYK